jgi:ribosomal-protein-alanine N-acetyltransferase
LQAGEIDFPMRKVKFQTLSSNRLILRKLALDDAREIFNLRSSEQVNQYLDRTPATNEHDAVEFINKIIGLTDRNEGFYWAICLKENPRLVGTICLFDFTPEMDIAEIGFELHPFYQHRGIMHEALSTVVTFSLQTLKLKCITAFPVAENMGSIKLLERNGFRLEEDGIQRSGNLVRYVLRP